MVRQSDRFCRLAAEMPARWVIAVVVLCGAGLVPAAPVVADNGEAAAQQQADPATRALRAADGLFQGGWHRLAAPEYEQFLERWPDHEHATIARYALALSRYHLGELEAAAGHIETVLEDDAFEHRGDALALLGYCRLSLGEHEQALEPVEALIDNHPDSPHFGMALVNRAHALYVLERFEDAEAAAGAVVEADVSEARKAAGHYLRAMARNRLGQYEDSEASARSLLEMDEALLKRYHVDALLLLGQALEQQGELEGAAAQFREMLDIAPDPRQAQARYSLGAVLYRLGEYAESVEMLEALLEAEAERDEPGRYVAPARLQLGIARLADDQVDEARSALEQVLEDDEDRADRARFWLAQCDMAEDEYAAARDRLDALSEAEPAGVNLAAVRFDRALCNAMLDEHETAAAQFEVFREQFEDDRRIGEAAYRQAYSLHQLEDYAASYEIAREVLEMEGHDFARPALELAAENLFLVDRYEAAASLYERLLEQVEQEQQQWPVTHLRLGQCAYYQEDYEAAIEWLEKVAADDRIAERRELQDVLFLLADARLQRQEHEASAEAWRRYLDTSEDEATREEARYKLAVALHRDGEGEEAAGQLEPLVDDGELASVWVQRAVLRLSGLVEGEEPERATELLEGLLDVDELAESLAAPATYRLAWLKLDGGDFEAAAEHFGRVADDFTEHDLATDSAYRRAVSVQRSGDYEAALERYEQYLAAYGDGDHVLEARFRAGLCELELERDEAAVDRFAALLDEEGLDDSRVERAQVLYELAWAHRGTGDSERAVARYRRIVEDHAGHETVTPTRLELAELLMDAGEHEEAAGLLEAAVDDEELDESQRATAMLRLAIAYDRLERDGDAGPAYSRFANGFGEHEQAPVARFNAALAFSNEEELEDAERELTHLIEDYPEHELVPRGLILRGQVQADRSDYEGSAASYEKFLADHEGHELSFRAHFGLGWAWENREQFEEARQSYQQVVEHHDGQTAARAQFQIGQTWFKEEDFEKAVRELMKVPSVYAYDEWSALALLEAGRAFEQLEDADSARRVYRQLVDGFADEPPAQQARGRLDDLGEEG